MRNSPKIVYIILHIIYDSYKGILFYPQEALYTMSTRNTLYRLFTIVLFVVLSSVSIYADDRSVPTEYASFLDVVNAPYAWNLGFTGQNVVVGVIDDSINMNHPFFKSNVDKASAYNFGIIYNNDIYKELLPTLPIQSATDTSAVWDKADIKKINFLERL